MKYNGFISYSHAADGKLAPALQSALHRLAKPWYKFRALRIFRDKTSLSANPALWASIEKALSESEWFLLMASPEVVKSPWVNREIAWWLENGSTEKILILLTEGDLIWDENTNDFDWSQTTAVPKLLSKRFMGTPLYVDLRWARTENHLTIRDARFHDAVLDIATPLHGVDKDQLAGEDVRQARLVKQLTTGTITAILAFAVIAVWQWREAGLQRNEATKQRDEAEAKELAAHSQVMIDQRGTLLHTAGLLAVEAMRRHPSIEADQAIRKVLAILPKHIATIDCAGKGEVESGTFSDDGRYLATAGKDGTVRISDTATGKLLHSFDMGKVRNILLRPGASELLVIEDTGSAYVFGFGIHGDMQARKQLPHVRVVAGAYSAGGEFLATVNEDHTTKLWDAVDYQEISTMHNEGFMHSVAISRDASELLAWNYEMVQVFRGPGQPEQTIKANGPLKISYSSDGKHMLMVDPRHYQFHLFDVIARRQLIFDKRHWNAAFSRDGRTIAVASPEWFAETYDLPSCYETGLYAQPTGMGTVEFKSIKGQASCRRGPVVRHDDSVNTVVLSNDGQYLATTSRDQTARVWYTWRGREALRILESAGQDIRGVSFSTDGRLISTWDRTGCWTWESTGHHEAFAVNHDDGVSTIAFSPDGRFLATIGIMGLMGQGPLRVLDVASRQEIKRLDLAPGLPRAWAVTFDSEGKRLLVNGSLIWNFGTDEKRSGNLDKDSSHRIAVDQTWKIKTRLNQEQVVVIEDFHTGAKLSERDFGEKITTVNMSANGCCIAVIAKDWSKIWHWREDLLEPLAEPLVEISYAEFDSSGRQLVTVGGKERTVVDVWELADKPRRVTSLEHEVKVNSAAFDPSGEYIVTGSADRGARIWHIGTGSVVAQLAHDDSVTKAEFSPDGRYVASAGGRNDRQVRVWLWRPNDLIREICDRLPRQLSRSEWNQYLHNQPYRETCTSLASEKHPS